MSPTIRIYIIIIALIIVVFCGFFRYKMLDNGSKLLCLLLSTDLISESLGLYTALKYHTNMPVYDINCLVEFLILCIYFNDVIDVFYKKNIGWHIGIAGVILGILNIIFLQPLSVFSSNFLLFEGFTLIAISLFALFRLIIKYEQLKLFRYHHFWFISIILVYLSITFLNFGFYDAFRHVLHSYKWLLEYFMWFGGIFNFTGMAIVFILYPKLQKVDE